MDLNTISLKDMINNTENFNFKEEIIPAEITLKEHNKNFFDGINFESFLKNALAIHLRFIPETVYHSKFEQSDKLLFNLFEEIWEVDDAYNNDTNNFEYIEDAIKEKVDVINYLGSIITLWLKDDETIYDKYVESINNLIKTDDKMNYSLIFEDGIMYLRKSSFPDLYNSAFEFNSFTGFIKKIIGDRRNFVERKWHKPFNPEDLQGDKRDDVIVKFLFDITVILIQLLGEFSTEKNRFSMIQKKQNKILALPASN